MVRRQGGGETMGMTLCIALGAAVLPGAPTIRIASGGAALYRIVVPEAPSAAMAYAAAELRKHIRDMSGADLEVVSEKQAVRGPAILLGPVKRSASSRLAAAARKLGPDGVLLKTVGKDLVLRGGGDRGHIYSVYVFLERMLGCRFLARDCTIVPRRDVITVPPTDYRYSPAFMYREILGAEMSDWGFAARLRLNGSNMPQVYGPWPPGPEAAPGVLIYPFVHSAAALVPAATYFADHPEYFGLVNGARRNATISGQPCWTHPDVLRIGTEQVMKWIAERPDMLCVDVSQNDAWPGDSGACQCEKCATIVKEEEAQHGPILRYVNAIADEVARKHPGKFVETLAYDYSIIPPRVTKPRPNVIIRLCHSACYFHGVTCDPLGANYRKAIDGWRAVARNLFVWHYGVNFWHYLAPNPNLVGMAKDLKYYAAHGVNGVMVQCDIQSAGCELSELRQYLAAQLMWDPSQDPMALREEFCRGYYGPAADDALAFLALMDKLAETNGQHRPMNGWHPPEIATAAFVKEGVAILNAALERSSDSVTRNRVEKLMLPLWFVQLAWPESYGVSADTARELLGKFKRVVAANKIATMSEGAPNVAPFIAALERKYGKLDRWRILLRGLTGPRRRAAWTSTISRRASRGGSNGHVATSQAPYGTSRSVALSQQVG